MSFDLGVWYPQKRIGNEQAGELYVRLCDSDTSGVVPHPAIDAFYAELTAKHPEIDTIPEERIDDHDYCPWSCKLDRSPGHVIMSCLWPKATYIHRLVQELARKHGLAVYDPQSEVVTYPDSSTGTRASRAALWVLGSFALLFAAMFVYSGQIAPSGAPLGLYVLAGLCGLMAVACFRQALRDTVRDGRKSRLVGKLKSSEQPSGRQPSTGDAITTDTPWYIGCARLTSLRDSQMETHVEFRSDKFPPFEGEEKLVNPDLWGKRLADFLREGLRKQGFETNEPIAEDWGWAVPVVNKSFRLWIGCGHYQEHEDGFLCFIEPHKPFVWRFFKRVDARERIDALRKAMDQVLAEAEGIRSKRWWTHEAFNSQYMQKRG